MRDSLLNKAAKSIRAELRLKYPAVKFSVKSRRYSGGDSIHLLWSDGPTREDVAEVTRKYEQGYFDGNTDSYVYDEDPQHKEFHQLRGSTKYVMLQRRRTQ